MNTITTVFLIYASVEDIRKLKVPILTFPILMGILILMRFLGYSELSLREVGWTFAVMLVYCAALYCFSEIGGADLLALLSLPLTLGRYSFVAAILSDLLCLPVVLFLAITKREKNYPFMPFITASYLITRLVLM